MPTYRIVVAYDGTRYSGWQKQPDLLSVEGILQETFLAAFKQASVQLLSASRTDAGVHALGQVVRIGTHLAINPKRLMFALNNRLPEDIFIRRAEIVSDSYSPHAQVTEKTYYYHLFTERPLPFIARYGWYYTRPFCIERLRNALSCFIGEHDFRSFCSVEDVRPNMIRTINNIQVHYLARFNAYRVVVTGERFLRHMIRRIVGAAITVATYNNDYDLEDLKRILSDKNPHHPLPNAPSKGLMLYRIMYHGDTHVQK